MGPSTKLSQITFVGHGAVVEPAPLKVQYAFTNGVTDPSTKLMGSGLKVKPLLVLCPTMYAIIAALFDINGKESTRRLKTLLAGNNGHPCNVPPGVRLAGAVYVVLVPLPGEIDPAPLKLKVAD